MTDNKTSSDELFSVDLLKRMNESLWKAFQQGRLCEREANKKQWEELKRGFEFKSTLWSNQDIIGVIERVRGEKK